jgi:hypothetical protein
MILVRKYRDNYGEVIVLCDKDLYGKKFEDGDFVLEINDFFKGEEKENISDEEINNCYFIYAVGEKSVKILKDKKLIDDNDVKRIKNIPYVFLLLL